MNLLSTRVFFTSLATVTAMCAALLVGCNDETAETPGNADNGASREFVATNDNGNDVGKTALIPQATPELAADTIPLRAPDGGPARYGLASGRLLQRYTGGMKGDRTVIFDKWGMRERKEENSAPNPPGRPGPIQDFVWVSRPDTFGRVDIRDKAGWKMKNTMDEQYLKSDSSKRMALGRIIMTSAPGQRLPDTVLNGYHCIVINNKVPGIDHTIWVWRGLTIREHFIAPLDSMEFWIETVELEPNVSVPDSTFQFPAGYPYEIVPPPAPGQQWIPPHLRPRSNQGQGPGGMPPSGGMRMTPPPGAVPPGAAPPGMAPPPMGR